MRPVAYGLVLLLSLELAVWEAFLVAARPFGTAFPLAAVLAVAGNVLLARAGRQVSGRPMGAYGPSLVWLAVAVVLSLPGPGGDAVVPGTGRGVLWLVAGMLASVAGAGLMGTNRASRATPQGQNGR